MRILGPVVLRPVSEAMQSTRRSGTWAFRYLKPIQQGEAIVFAMRRQDRLRTPAPLVAVPPCPVFRHCAELIVASSLFDESGISWNSPSDRLYEHRKMHPPSKGKAQLAVESDSRMV
jgi:hypothetical protein